MSRRIRIILILAALALVVGWPTVSHYRARHKAENYRRQLKGRGEKLTIAELIPPPVDEGNGARALVAAANRLNRGYAFSNQPPTMKYLPAGHAMVAWQQDVLPTSESTNLWPGLDRDVEAKQDVLEEIRAALQSPVIAPNLNYNQGAQLALPHLAMLKSIAQWLSAATILELHEGRTSNAWDNLRALTALVERDKQEPIMISVLVRIAIGAIAFNATWEALQSPSWQEQQLRELQAGWESIDWLAHAGSALEMERAMGEKTFTELRSSYATVASGGFFGANPSLAQLGQELLDDPKSGLRNLAHRYPGYWGWKCWQSYEDELVHMQLLQASIEAVRKAGHARTLGPALQQFSEQAGVLEQAHPRAGRWLGYSLLQGSIHRYLARVSWLEMQRSLLVAAIGLKRYQLKNGAYPGELAALVPDILAQLPRDPMDGQPLRYRLNPDGSFLLYSVGEDGGDNGGDTSQPTTQSNAKQWRARDAVWPEPNLNPRQWWRARDVVWPWPATPAEVQADFEKIALERKRREQGAPTAEAEAFRRRYGLTLPSPVTSQTTNGTNMAR